MSSLIKRQQPNAKGDTSRAVERLKHQFSLSGVDSKRQLILGLLLPNITNPFRRPSPCLIRLILDDTTKKIWYPGDDISGTIRLIVNEPIAVRHITLTLSGSTKAKTSYSSLEGQIACGSHVTLFSQAIDIVPNASNPSSSILAPKRYEYPFSLSFPQTCQDVTGPDFKEATRLFDNSHTQNLPPSFSDGKPNESCKVTYSIVGTLSKKSSPQTSTTFPNLIPGTKPVTHTIPLTVRPTPEPIPSTPIPPLIKRSTLSVRSSIRGFTSPRTSESSLSRLKSTLKPFASPVVSFHLFAHLPRYGIAGRHLPFTLSLSYEASPKKNDLNKVILTALNVTLISKTTTRTVPLDPTFEMRATGTVGSLLSSWQGKLSIASLDRSVEMPVEPERLDVGEILDEKGCGSCLIPKETVGNIRTFNIFRNYSLRVEAEVEYNNKKARAGFTVEGFMVLEEGKTEMDDSLMEEITNKGSPLGVVRSHSLEIRSETTAENSEDGEGGELIDDEQQEAKEAITQVVDNDDLLVKEGFISVPGEDALLLKIKQPLPNDEEDNSEGIELTEAEDVTTVDEAPRSISSNRNE